MWTPAFLIEITEIEIDSAFLPFLYQALQRPHQFVAHAAGIAVYAEEYRLGVRTVGVVAAPDLCFPYVSEYYVHSIFFCLKRNQIAIFLLSLRHNINKKEI